MVERASILLIDDNETFLEQFAPYLIDEQGADVIPTTSAKDALDLIGSTPVDLVICDIQMPEMSGIEFFTSLQDSHPELPVIFVTSYSSIEQAAQLVKQGAFHYFEKPVINKLDLFSATVREALDKGRMLKALARFQKEESLRAKAPDLVPGRSPAMQKVLQSVEDAARVSVTVLFTGETGTGKDVLARALHQMSDRSANPFFAVNCAEFAEGILESELFGHEKGAFTGAISRRKGLFELAHQGALFLDEISEASPALQSKLLRVVETRTFMRLGGSTPIRSDFRLIAATNRNLMDDVAGGRFRQDLLYRLNVYTINIPPLRERKDDIPLLAEFYLKKFSRSYHRPIEGFSAKASLALLEYDWPGNVRELVNVVERAVVTCRGSLITLEHLPFHPDKIDREGESDLNLKDAERFLIEMAMKRSKGNKVKASEMLGINRKTLAEKLKNYGMAEDGDGRNE